MYLTRHLTPQGIRWARDGHVIVETFSLSSLLSLSAKDMLATLEGLSTGEDLKEHLLAPIESEQEVWASGVTYLRSREARKLESEVGDVYEKVYDATRPELFFKALGWRVQGEQQPLRIRRDSDWNVPEPELVLLLNSQMEIVGYCAGNDMSSRSIEGENPLYLPQAKVYNGSCGLGPGILLASADQMRSLPIALSIYRNGTLIFHDEVSTVQMKRTLEELASYLGRELAFPRGAFLMTGTGIVPPDQFSLQPGDQVHIQVGGLALHNPVA
ncbi:2-hydroxyhepta-2,4-diene-1,7-dioate isomerase [Ktedonobacter sp. SOSP1-52]|uniref:fumarylacetoacetate hydrolase family protein n=1 Tax=Ktedonobacter sp. SOSP1-52 TaxID=2778366 RepID=UPI001916603F|nr:fumarylacetoacetate hydrolase family protein [Ktedonobacter sp. SOSP1-52]GHO69891.1 2-hydroxyhepta-2,4-diene-1,7-dioate isomerase [Ktedonobacter sp. SOSP1-52]